MTKQSALDCIVIGYNELPFERYEQLLSAYGEESEAYRDLRFSFVKLGGEKLDYIGLLNKVYGDSRAVQGVEDSFTPFRSGAIPSLAAAYLCQFLQRRGLTADYINLYQSEKERLAELLSQNPICVAITTTFYVLDLPVVEMVEFIRSHNKNVKIIVGGPLVGNLRRANDDAGFATAMRDMDADICVLDSQGEQTLAQIITALKKGTPLDFVPNLAFFQRGVLHFTPSLPESNSLDENYVDWSNFSAHALGQTIQMRTARSCAFNCAFCNYPKRAGKLSLASLDTVEKELDSILLQGASHVVFIDDTFNVPLPRFKDLCRLMIRKQYDVNWFSYFRCSNSDEEAIDLMAESGCKGVFLGIESGSPEILKNMNKAATVEKYSDGIRMLHERGILSFASFIVGFPGETADTVRETMEFIQTTQPDYFRAQLWYCESGTPIELQREKYKIKGDGFLWQHATMSSLEAMDHIDRLFLSIEKSCWLPQWSFDFWVIPYLFGRNLAKSQFHSFMRNANEMLALEIGYCPEDQKQKHQSRILGKMMEDAGTWKTCNAN